MSVENPQLEQFEQQLAELEELVRTLESGEIQLEQAVKHFERGMTLSGNCDRLLRQAELRVQQLSQDAEGREALIDGPASAQET